MKDSYLMDTLRRRERVIVGGEGSYLIDVEGNRLLDMYGDNGASGLGYKHPIHLACCDALRSHGLVHSMDLYPHLWREAAAEAICRAAGMDRVFFCTSGTEGVEAAIKLARKIHWDRFHSGNSNPAVMVPRCEIWTVYGGFHGRTYASMAASDGPAYHYDGFGPFLDKFHRFDIDLPESISSQAAAVLLAPVFGVHDVIPYTRFQLNALRRYCDENGILLIFDETQSGSYRTGQYTYWQYVGVKPDIVTFAKGAAGGFPIGGMMTSEQHARALTPGSHFSTWGGNPASVLWLKMFLDYMGRNEKRQELIQKAKETRALLEEQPWIKKVRNAGLLFAFDTDFNANEFATKCDEAGLIIGSWRENPVRFTPPLDAPMRDVRAAVDIMAHVAGKMV